MMKTFWILFAILSAVGFSKTLENYFYLSLQDNGDIKYDYQKTYWPYCSWIHFQGRFESMAKPDADKPQRRIITTEFTHKRTNSYISSQRVNPFYIQYAHYYEGVFTPHVQWFTAQFTLNCYYAGNAYNTKSASITRDFSGTIGGLYYPQKGRMAVAGLARDWNWDHLIVEQRTRSVHYNPGGFYNHKTEHIKSFYCYPPAATLTKTGIIIVECGAFELYGFSQYSLLALPKITGLNLRTIANTAKIVAQSKTYYHKNYLDRVFLPLPMIIMKTNYVKAGELDNYDSSYLKIEYLHQLYTLADFKFFQIEEDKRFSDANDAGLLYNGTDTQLARCKDTGGIRNHGKVDVSQNSEYGDALYPATLALNGDKNDFTHTDPRGDKWWMVYKQHWAGIGHLAIWSRSGYYYRLSNFYILTALGRGRLIPALRTGIWTQRKYFKPALGSHRTDLQFYPIIQLDHLAIFSENNMDALSLAEIETYDDCAVTFKAKVDLRPGVDYILTAFQYGISGSIIGNIFPPGLPSKKVSTRFHVKALNGMVDSNTCQTYKFDVLKEYYGCKGLETLTEQKKTECKARYHSTLKDLLNCLAPNADYNEIPADKEQPKKWPEDSATISRNYVDYVDGSKAKAQSDSLIGAGNMNTGSWCLLIIFVTANKMFL